MRHMIRPCLYILLCIAPQVLAGCAASYGFVSSRSSERRTEFCDSVRTFVRSPLDEAGLRRAWFLPFGVYKDGSIDFYAPMAAKPRDDVSKAFYGQGVGQLTHYTHARGFAFEFSRCLTKSNGFVALNREMNDAEMRGSFTDRQMNRRIEIVAGSNTTSILVADADWIGDVREAMTYTPVSSELVDELP